MYYEEKQNMCIIMYSPKNVEIPKTHYLDNANAYNPDGAGFFVKTASGIVISKGYTNVDKMVADINKATNNNPKKYDIGIHFRMSTHGITDAGNCHPFAISGNRDVLRNTHNICINALMHNGIISGVKADPKGLLSDTMMFIKDSVKKFRKQRTATKLLNDTNGKFLLFNKDYIYKKGLVLNKEDGCYYSNNSYLDYVDCFDYGAYTQKFYKLDEKTERDLVDRDYSEYGYGDGIDCTDENCEDWEWDIVNDLPDSLFDKLMKHPSWYDAIIYDYINAISEDYACQSYEDYGFEEFR